MAFVVNRLSDILGAEIKGLNLSQPLGNEVLNDILELLYQYQVLVFRDQFLTPEQQISLCNALGEITHGEISENPGENRSSNYPEVRILSNITTQEGRLGYPPPPVHIWHSDLCYHPRPATITTLQAHIVPEQGGDTIFANMYAAYERLPEDIKQKIDNCEAVFSTVSSTERLRQRCKEIGHTLQPPAEIISLPDVVHPCVKVHPVTKRKAIFVNHTHTDKILGLSEEESSELLQKIFAHSIRTEFIYCHKYLPGDLVMIDNFSLIHTSTYTDPKYPRLMHRVWLVDRKDSKTEQETREEAREKVLV
jgi:taurine dioxygenase